jgi:hypothetical protein
METQLILFDMSPKYPKYWIQTYFDFDPSVWTVELRKLSHILTLDELPKYNDSHHYLGCSLVSYMVNRRLDDDEYHTWLRLFSNQKNDPLK